MTNRERYANCSDVYNASGLTAAQICRLQANMSFNYGVRRNIGRYFWLEGIWIVTHFGLRWCGFRNYANLLFWIRKNVRADYWNTHLRTLKSQNFWETKPIAKKVKNLPKRIYIIFSKFHPDWKHCVHKHTYIQINRQKLILAKAKLTSL